jgi:hypothetical protein
MKRFTNKIWLLLLLAFFAPVVAQCGNEKANMNTKKPSMTIEEIAALESVGAIKKLAKERGLSFSVQSLEAMKAQRVPEFEQAKTLGANGRIWITFWVREAGDTVHVSFFFDASEGVISRQIKIETNNLP